MSGSRPLPKKEWVEFPPSSSWVRILGRLLYMGEHQKITAEMRDSSSLDGAHSPFDFPALGEHSTDENTRGWGVDLQFCGVEGHVQSRHLGTRDLE